MVNEDRLNKTHDKGNFAVRHQSGFTVIELMITLAIAALILTLAAPNMGRFIEKRRLIAAAEAVAGQLQYARSEAISRSKPVYLRISANNTTTWDVGMSLFTNCSPLVSVARTDANACVLPVDDGDGNVDPGDGSVDTDDLVLKTLHSTDFSNVVMSTTNSEITFDPARGTAESAVITLKYGTKYEIRVGSSVIGRVRLSSPSGSTHVEGY